MSPSSSELEAIDRIKQSKDGRVFFEFLQKLHQHDIEFLGMNNKPEMHGIAQGLYRQSKTLVSLFKPKQGT